LCSTARFNEVDLVARNGLDLFWSAFLGQLDQEFSVSPVIRFFSSQENFGCVAVVVRLGLDHRKKLAEMHVRIFW
jgi:hypothetical protein